VSYSQGVVGYVTSPIHPYGGGYKTRPLLALSDPPPRATWDFSKIVLDSRSIL